jgi:hypothetical protein
MNRTDVTYRKTAAEGASGFGLLIALYDTLAGDLRRAAEAERSNDIEQRCHDGHQRGAVVFGGSRIGVYIFDFGGSEGYFLVEKFLE